MARSAHATLGAQSRLEEGGMRQSTYGALLILLRVCMLDLPGAHDPLHARTKVVSFGPLDAIYTVFVNKRRQLRPFIHDSARMKAAL